MHYNIHNNHYYTIQNINAWFQIENEVLQADECDVCEGLNTQYDNNRDRRILLILVYYPHLF